MRFLYGILSIVFLFFYNRPIAVGQVLDPSFAASRLTTPATGILTALRQPDGKVLISGFFQLMDGQPSTRLARLNADGSPDLAFRAQAGSGPNSIISALALQADGKILLGAEYSMTSYNGLPAQQLIRLNADGSLDNSFYTGAAGWVGGGIYNIAVQPDGKILVAGSLTSTFNGRATNGLIRLLTTGQIDASFVTGSGFINTSSGESLVRKLIIQPNGNIVAAGTFTAVNGRSCNSIARLFPTGSLDTSFTSAFRPAALGFDMVQQPDGKLVVGGLSLLSISPASNLVRLLPNGAIDASFTPPQPNSIVFSVGLRVNGSILVAGGFFAIGGSFSQGLARFNSTGTLDAAFATSSVTDGNIMKVVELNNGQYLAAGFFSRFGGRACDGIVRLLTNGTLDTTYTVQLEDVADCFATPQTNGQLLLHSNSLARFNGASITPTGTQRYHLINANGTYNSSIPLPSPIVRPGGGNSYYFYSTSGPQPNGTLFAAYQNSDSTVLIRRILSTGAIDPTFTEAELGWSRPYPPCCLVASVNVHPSGGVLVHGFFTKVNGQNRRYLARLRADGTLNTQFAPPASAVWQVPSTGPFSRAGFEYAVGLANDQTLVQWNDSVRSYLVRLNPNGLVDNTFSIGTGGGPRGTFGTMRLTSGKLMVNGTFTSFNGQAAPYGLVRLLLNGAPDPSFTAVSSAKTLVEQPDGKLLALAFGANASSERLLRFTAAGNLDTGFQPVAISNEVSSYSSTNIGLQPGTNAIVLSGYFTRVAGQPRFGLARLVNTPLAARNSATQPMAEIFPNPAHDRLHVRLPSPPTAELTLTDLQGRLVRRWAPAQAMGSLSVAGLAPGVYVLRIPLAAGPYWQRLVVE